MNSSRDPQDVTKGINILKGRARKKETKGKTVNFTSVARPQYPENQPNIPLDASVRIF